MLRGLCWWRFGNLLLQSRWCWPHGHHNRHQDVACLVASVHDILGFGLFSASMDLDWVLVLLDPGL